MWGPAVNDQNQRILAILLEIGGIEEHAVFRETVRPFPLESFGFAKCQRGDLVIEVRQTSRLVVDSSQGVQLCRLRRRAAGEGDLALRADKGAARKSPL